MRSRYLHIDDLGSGSFGRVTAVLDQATGRTVALKELISFDADARTRFEREARLYRQLNNLFIVELLDKDLEDNPPYLVFEYCEHGSLRGWVQQSRPWRHVGLALGHVLQGVSLIHQLGGFHRDLKPENLLVASAPTGGVIIKVADLGLARLPETISKTMTRNLGGTPGYIAPEVLRGADFHQGADIYSLGVIATELLTGQSDPAGLNTAPIPAQLKELVLLMLSPDRTKRPTAPQIAQALHGLLNPPAPPPAPAPAPKPAPTNSGSLFGGLLLGGALLGLLALAKGDAEWDKNVERYRGPDGRFSKS